MKRPRDNQRSKLYKWQQKNLRFLSVDLPKREKCETLIQDTFDRYGIRVPKIKFLNNYRRYARGGHEEISLPLWARNKRIILHECAHGIIDSKFGEYKCAWHGPEFLKLFIDLLVWQQQSTIQFLNKSAKDAGLKIGRRTIRPKIYNWEKEMENEISSLVAKYKEKLNTTQIKEILKGMTWETKLGIVAQAAEGKSEERQARIL